MIRRSPAGFRPRKSEHTLLPALVIVCGSFTLFAGSGCGSDTPPPKLPRISLPSVVSDSPESAARTLLNTLRAEVSATAYGDKAAAKAASDQAVTLAASDVITARQPRGAAPDTQVKTIVGLWGALIAHYVADFQVDSPRVIPLSPTAAMVEFSVTGRATTLRAECVRVATQWRVAALEYVGVRASSRPATTSASN